MVFLLPIFFTYTGLSTQIGSLDTAAAWGWCALQIGLSDISQPMFTMLVLMAIVSTVITTLGLRRWLPQIGQRA
jgi:Kef-type K+ transport system membrane component KefB